MINIFGLWDFTVIAKSWILLFDDRIVAAWNVRPSEDPADGEYPDMVKFNAWLINADEFLHSLKLSVREALDLHTLSVNAGWNQEEHGYIEYWLFEEMGRLLKK